MSEIKDVKCEHCNRVIGRRDNHAFYQFNMRFLFDRSGKISCPFVECGFENVFRVNRNSDNAKILIDKQFAIV